jgi:cystathionine beta-lyase/cystathionine gamma-synthase
MRRIPTNKASGGTTMRFRSKLIHEGVTPDPTTGAILTPIYQSTTFVQDSVDSYLEKGYSYSRTNNPTVRALEKKLAALEEGADATCYGTGMSAISCTMLAFLNAGDHAIISDVAYGGTYRLCTTVLNRFGIEFSFADTSDPDNVKSHVRDNTRLFLTETPANPTMKVSDIAAVSEIASALGAIHVVDNTFLTPVYQQPLELGADLSLHSTTKYFDGHNATVGGAVIAKSKEHDEKLRFIQNSTGSIMSPMVAWLTLQGTKTLAVRLEQQSASAMAIARFLESHEKVQQVAYPGLESFSQHDLSTQQASGYGAMMWFEVKGGLAAGKQFMDSIELWSLAENLGSTESLVTHPATMTHAAVDPAERERVGIIDGLVRLSVGLEDTDDLIDALAVALDKVDVRGQ